MDGKWIIAYACKTDGAKPRRQLLDVAKCMADNLGMRCMVVGSDRLHQEGGKESGARIASVCRKHPLAFILRHLRHTEIVLTDGRNSLRWGAGLLRLFCPRLRVVGLESLGLAAEWGVEDIDHYVNHTLLPQLGYTPLAFAHNF